LTKLQRV